ncbi:MAG TPA: FAD/NAD(P)-binding protein [Thermoplasmata archaeon]|nr:FAD/NAD(P)-binding protein [Thermoplasmata archaeon]
MAASGVPPGPTGEPAASPFVPRPYVVESRATETADTVTMVLRAAHGRSPPPFAPGQFNMVYRFGLGEVAISISGDPRRPHELVHTVRSAGKITDALSRVVPGETVGVRGPYGVGWPLEAAEGKDVVLVAGGLGLPPLRPLLYELLARRAHVGRIEVIYGARSPRDLVYYHELQGWRAREDLRFQVTVDAAGRDWYGDVGLVTARLPDARFEPARTVAYLCGPEIMMRLTAKALAERGVPPGAIFLSMERNMKCAVGLCGHCQYGPSFVCRDGPVFSYQALEARLALREV